MAAHRALRWQGPPHADVSVRGAALSGSAVFLISAAMTPYFRITVPRNAVSRRAEAAWPPRAQTRGFRP